jgi:hypothetical protein
MALFIFWHNKGKPARYIERGIVAENFKNPELINMKKEKKKIER